MFPKSFSDSSEKVCISEYSFTGDGCINPSDDEEDDQKYKEICVEMEAANQIETLNFEKDISDESISNNKQLPPGKIEFNLKEKQNIEQFEPFVKEEVQRVEPNIEEIYFLKTPCKNVSKSILAAVLKMHILKRAEAQKDGFPTQFFDQAKDIIAFISEKNKENSRLDGLVGLCAENAYIHFITKKALLERIIKLSEGEYGGILPENVPFYIYYYELTYTKISGYFHDYSIP
jgi:hypothetical protein